VHEGLPGHLHRRVMGGGHRAGLTRQERGEVPRDAGVLRVGQRHLRETGAPCDLRHIGDD